MFDGFERRYNDCSTVRDFKEATTVLSIFTAVSMIVAL